MSSEGFFIFISSVFTLSAFIQIEKKYKSDIVSTKEKLERTIHLLEAERQGRTRSQKKARKDIVHAQERNGFNFFPIGFSYVS